jgi:signal transduction histidine kinase/chaperonin cofactor prefoldin
MEDGDQPRAEISALLKATRAVLEHRDFLGAAQAIFEACKEITRASSGYIALVEEDQNLIAYLDTGNSPCEVDPALPMPIRGLRSKVFHSGETIIANTFANSEWYQLLPEGHVALENVLFAPLLIKGSPVGILGLGNKPGGFTSTDARLGTAFAEIAAIALVNSRAQQALREAHDELEIQVQQRTGQLNQAVQELQSELSHRIQVETQLEETNRYLLTLSKSEHDQRQLAETLTSVSQALSQTLDLDTVIDTLLERLQDLIHYDMAWILLLEDQDHLSIRATRGVKSPSDMTASRLPLSDFPDFQVILNRQESRTTSAPLPLGGRESNQLVPVFEWLGAPLVAAGAPLGLCILVSSWPDRYTAHQVRTVDAIISLAAVAIQNARLYQAERHARQIADILRQASLTISQSLELDTVLTSVLDNLASLIDFDAGFIALLDDEANFVVHTTRGDPDIQPGQNETIKYLSHDLLTQDMLENSEGILIQDTHAYFNIQVCPSPKCLRSWIMMPLRVGEKIFGFCLLQKAQANYFTQEQFRLVEALVSQAAVAGQNAWLFDQVRSGHERLKDLSHRMVQIQENERSYIARELHDETGQALASLILGLDLIERSAQKPEKIIEGVAQLEAIVSRVMENLHRIAMNLRPAALDHLGLADALRQYVQGFAEIHSIAVLFDSMGVNERLPEQVEVALYRIAQEALTNVIRHAHATQIQVLLEKAESKLRLTIQDNGVGFDPKARVEHNGMGLVGIRERVSMLGGQLAVTSTPGEGTVLRIEIPWVDEANAYQDPP